MGGIHYISFGQEGRWAMDLSDRKSFVIVGERGSGLSTVVEHLLKQMKTPEGGMRRAVRCSSRLLGSGTGFLTNLAYECVRVFYEDGSNDVIEHLLSSLRGEFTHTNLVDLFGYLRAEREMPLVILDRFEALAGRLTPDAWAGLRYLLENGLLQLVVLSRLSIAEIETLTGSKLRQTIGQEILPPLRDVEALRVLVRSELGALEMEDPVVDYIASICGGHRSLTKSIARLVGVHAEPETPTREFVDTVIGSCQDQAKRFVIEAFSALGPIDSVLPGEMGLEFQCALEIEHAPRYVTGIHSVHFKRLARLGHVQHENGSVVRFASALIRSRLRMIWLAATDTRVDPACKFSSWLDLDESLRGLLRTLYGASVLSVVEASGPQFDSYVSEFKRDQAWWSGEVESDVLDYMNAGALYDLMESLPEMRSVDLYRDIRDTLSELATVRRTVLEKPWEILSRERRRQIEAQVLNVKEKLDTNSKRHSRSEVVDGAKGKQEAARVLRWLHISDVHFKKERVYGEELALEALLSTLRADLTRNESERIGPRPDVVFFTGDLAFSGLSEEYARASVFFDTLLEVLQLERDRLFVIPGNHDVDRRYTRYLERSPSDGSSAYVAFRDERWRRLYGERTTAFFDWYREYFAAFPERMSRAEHGALIPQRIVIRGVELAAILLNAQWCGGLDDDREHLVAGAAVLMEDLGKFWRQGRSPDLTVALLHQPLEYFAEFERKDLLTFLSETADVLLRGHHHDNDVIQTVRSLGELVEFSAGALFNDPDHANAAQIVEMNVDSRQYVVYPIRYEAKQNRWERDTSLGRPPTYVLHGKLHGDKGASKS